MGYSNNTLVCAKCGKMLVCEDIGIVVRAKKMLGKQNCDKYTCPLCGYSVYTGFGLEYGFDSDNVDVVLDE